MLYQDTIQHLLILCLVQWICVEFSQGAGNIDNRPNSGHGSHRAMNPNVKVKQGGLQDFGGEEDPDNQLKREAFVRNKEHIREHFKGNVDFDPDTLNPDELDFHFFKIHDTNNDDSLDGLELLSSIAHGLDEQYDKVEQSDLDEEIKKRKMKGLNNRSWIAVDRILREDDGDKNGYLSYSEYKDSRRANKLMHGESGY